MASDRRARRRDAHCLAAIAQRLAPLSLHDPCKMFAAGNFFASACTRAVRFTWH